ncbi:hypothetical protein GCM10010981_22960 [Dyella nitratireducens]|uniref:Secreted protein n=1 Tax=Dyella nitratireducens TaxID=1849580 RepID=A0ABQ1FXQ4_9GAMM|nr:hypothetical protein GCM10010981_22960 [Dyella nitratireducens]
MIKLTMAVHKASAHLLLELVLENIGYCMLANSQNYLTGTPAATRACASLWSVSFPLAMRACHSSIVFTASQ